MGRSAPWQSALVMLCLLSSVSTAVGEDSTLRRALENEEQQSHNRELFFASNHDLKRKIRGPGHGTRMGDFFGSDRTSGTSMTRNGPGRLGQPGAAASASATSGTPLPVEMVPLPGMTRPYWRPLRSNPNQARGPGPMRAGTRNPTPDFGAQIPEFIINRRISIIRQRGGRFHPDRFSLGTSATTTATATSAAAAPSEDSAASASNIISSTAPSVVPNETGSIAEAIVTTPPDTEETAAPTVEASATEAPDTADTSPPTPLVARTAADPMLAEKCSTEPHDIQIGVDIQLKFPESGLVVCRQEDRAAILTTIQSVLNTALPPEASSRTISATTPSSTFVFDDRQTIDNQKYEQQQQDENGIPDLSLFKPVSAATGSIDNANIAGDPQPDAPLQPTAEASNIVDDPIPTALRQPPAVTSGTLQPNLRKFIPSTTTANSDYLQAKDAPPETTAIAATNTETAEYAPIPVHHASRPTMRDVEGSSQSDNEYSDNNGHESRPTMREVGGSDGDGNIRQRKLQDGTTTCPERVTTCPGNADFCLFGCMLATTRDCGSSDRWVALGSNIGDALGEMNLACLGSPNVPVVEVNVF